MNYYYKTGQLHMSDRIAIETGICRGDSFKKIAKRIRRHPTTVSHEVKTNRTVIKGHFFWATIVSLQGIVQRRGCVTENVRMLVDLAEVTIAERFAIDMLQRSAASTISRLMCATRVLN